MQLMLLARELQETLISKEHLDPVIRAQLSWAAKAALATTLHAELTIVSSARSFGPWNSCSQLRCAEQPLPLKVAEEKK